MRTRILRNTSGSRQVVNAATTFECSNINRKWKHEVYLDNQELFGDRTFAGYSKQLTAFQPFSEMHSFAGLSRARNTFLPCLGVD